MFADQKSEQYLLESCENGRLSGRMLHHREHVWVEGQKQAVRELALKEPIKGPAAVYHLALLLQKISRANTATVVDSRRKEFLQHDKSPFDLVVECSENARDRGTVVIVDVDDLAGIMVDQQTQRGSSRQKAEGGMQETTAQSFHVAREHALQNIISFSRSLAQRVQPSGNTFCLCVLSTAHPFILRRLGHGMIFGLPEAPFNPPLYSQLGYEVLDSTGLSKVQRVQSGQDGFIPLVSPLVAKDAEPLLVEVTMHSIKDDLEFGFTSPVNVPSGTLVSSKSAATLTWKEWCLHSRGQSKPLKEKPEQHPDLPQVIFLIQQDSWLAVGWLSKAGAPILSEDLGVDLGGVAHPFISLKTPADTASVKVYGGLGNFPLPYLEAYQNVLAKDRGVLVFALPYSEYSESAMERLPWYEATIPDGVRTIRITACGPGGRGAKGVANQRNGAGGASGAVVDATFSVTAGAKKLCVELGAHLNPKDTNLKPASSTKIYESETGQRDIANVRRDVLLEAGGGGLQDIVGEGFAKTSDFMQLTSAVVKKGNPGEKASPMMTNSWENTPNGGAASWPREILEMIQRKFPVIDTKNRYGQTRQQRFVPQIGGGGPGGSHNGGGIPGAFTGAPGACVIQFDPTPQATEGN